MEEIQKTQEESPDYIKSPEIEENNKIIYTLRTTPNREDQVVDFITAKVKKKGIGVYSIIRPHGMRGYIFIEALNRTEAEQGVFGIPYARGLLKEPISYHDIEHMVKEEKVERDIRKNDIAELISGPFKREKCKIVRVDPVKEEIVIELLEAAIPIPITVSMDAIKVIRREGGQNE